MAAPQIHTFEDVRVRARALKRRDPQLRDDIKSLAAWRSQQIDTLEPEIWKGVAENVKRWTIVKSDVSAIDRTTRAFLLGDTPQITVNPKDPGSLLLSDQADLLERVIDALLDWINRDRVVPIEEELIAQDVEVGHIVIKALWLSPAERGESRQTVQRGVPLNIPGLEELDQPTESITAEGDAPYLIQFINPLQAYWNLGKNNRVLEIVHEFRLTYGELIDLYPDLAQRGEWKHLATAEGYERLLTVTDYWNEEINAILIEHQEYKRPTQHHYGRVPFIVELVNPELTYDTEQDVSYYRGVPFCLPILDHVRALSWAESVSASYLEEVGFALLKHRGINPTPGASPYIDVNTATRQAEYIGEFDFSPDGRVVPLYAGEDLEYLHPPAIVDVLQEFKQARGRDIQLMTYAEGILTGVYNIDLSGYSVSQQKQAALARLNPYEIAGSRAYSRLVTWLCAMTVQEWDRNTPYMLDSMTGGTTNKKLSVTREHFDAIGSVTVKLRPKVPVNPEAEQKTLLEGMAYDIYTLRYVMEQRGVENPRAAMMERAWEKMVLTQPQFQMALAQQFAEENGYRLPPGMGSQGQQGAAPPPAIGPGAAPQQGGMDPSMTQGGGMPPQGMDPSMMQQGGPPQGMDPSMQGGAMPQQGGPAGLPQQILSQLPPELAQQISQLPPDQQFMALRQIMMQAQQGGGQSPMQQGPPGAQMGAGGGMPMGAMNG